MLNGLDLFSGIGGIGLALAPWVRPIAYCEIDPYARAVLLSRMADGSIANAPIWDDVCTLRGSDLPSVDIIFGGFPCQDLSLAGARAGLDGKRSGLFFQIMRLVDEVQPSFIFLENVPGVRQHANRVFAELAARGFDARWLHLAASDVGAPHKRERWWCLAANTNSFDVRNKQGRIESRPGLAGPGFDGTSQPLANTKGIGGGSFRTKEQEPQRTDRISGGGALGDTHSERQPQPQGVEPEQWRRPFDASWWSSEPDVGRVAHGVPKRVDRLRGLGNAVVPATAREAFRILAGIGGAA